MARTAPFDGIVGVYLDAQVREFCKLLRGYLKDVVRCQKLSLAFIVMWGGV